MATKKEPAYDLNELRIKLSEIADEILTANEQLVIIKEDDEVSISKAAFLVGSAHTIIEKAWDKLDNITDELYDRIDS